MKCNIEDSISSITVAIITDYNNITIMWNEK